MNATPSGLIERLLAERIGLDPSSVGETLIARGVHVRMTALGLRSKLDYEQTLVARPEELQALVEEIVVPESWFFRDERPFEVLGRFASEGWAADTNRPPLTALSVPCASGEEPYSIAMTLLETGLPADRFRVDAVDVSARSLAKAIAGVYGSNAFRGVASSRRSSYFREHHGAFTLDLAVRSTVKFRNGNLLDPTLFADRPPFDVVFCRNLLIYLDDDAKTRAFATLARLVAEGGLLFLGHADRFELLEGARFEPIADKGSFGYRKGGSPPSPALRGRDPASSGQRPGKSSASNSNVKLAKPPQAPPAATAQRKPEPTTPAVVSGRTSVPHPKPSLTEQREPAKSAIATILDQASTLADSGQYDEASALVERSIAEGGSNARAYFLLGLIAQAAGHRDRAEAHYLKAIYLDSQHDEALTALAVLARRKGDVAAEAGYRRRAERVLARKVIP